jgi:hypothetical protein
MCTCVSDSFLVLVYDLQTAKAQQPKTLLSPSAYSWSSSPKPQQPGGSSSVDATTVVENESSEKHQQQPSQNTTAEQQQQQAETNSPANSMKPQQKHCFDVPPAHDDAVLAVSAHDRYPLLASGAMTADRKVLFWGPDDSNYTIPKRKYDNNLLGGFF